MADSKLHFSPDGAILIYEHARQLQVWQLQERRLLHRHDGKMIGIARDSRSFLLESGDGSISAYDLHTGTTLPIDSLNPEDYPIGQRCSLRLERRSIAIVDALRGEEIVTVQLSDLVDTSSGNPAFTNARLSQDGSFVALTIEGDSTWGEWARGYCLHLNGDVHFEFSVNSAANRPILETAGHYLMVETRDRERALWDMRTGELAQTIPIADAKKAGLFMTVNEAESPPVAAIHADRRRVDLLRGRVLVARLTTEPDLHAAEFYPDNRHLALLLETGRSRFMSGAPPATKRRWN